MLRGGKNQQDEEGIMITDALHHDDPLTSRHSIHEKRFKYRRNLEKYVKEGRDLGECVLKMQTTDLMKLEGMWIKYFN